MDSTKSYLSVYQVEPLGRILVDGLRLPIPVITILFMFLYFGVLLILHTAAGHPLPLDVQGAFRLPAPHYYYPNLIGITFDLIGNPLFFVFLCVLRRHVPRQFVRLAQADLIRERRPSTRWHRLVRRVTVHPGVQHSAAWILPLLSGLNSAVLTWLTDPPADLPGRYALFLTFLGSYATTAVVVQLVYVFLILSNHTLEVRLNLAHPDQCAGLAPLGNLAIAAYVFLFCWAMVQAVGLSAGGGAIERLILDASGSFAFLYLWILFPLGCALIYDRLVYQPHRALRDLQRQVLEASSRNWTRTHHQIHTHLVGTLGDPEQAGAIEVDRTFDDELALLENWAKLDATIAQTHTWPISRARFRVMSVLVNPFVPILIPTITDTIQSLLQ